MSALPNAAWRVLAGVAWTAAALCCAAASGDWPYGVPLVVGVLALAIAGAAVAWPDTALPSVAGGGLALWWIAAGAGPLATCGMALLLLTGHVAAAVAAPVPPRGATTLRAASLVGRDWLALAAITVAASALAAASELHDPTAPDALFWFVAALATVAAIAALLARRRRE